jgi:hypothetical protein
VSYEITSSIPLPERKYNAGGNWANAYPFSKMIPGDSFLVSVGGGDSNPNPDPTEYALAAKRLGSAAHCWAKSHKLDWKFCVRRRPEETGVRIWRKS